MHLSRLIQLRIFPERPKDGLVVEEGDRFNIDDSILPEYSWEGDLDEGEFKVKKIMDVRSGRKTRYGRVHQQFMVVSE